MNTEKEGEVLWTLFPKILKSIRNELWVAFSASAFELHLVLHPQMILTNLILFWANIQPSEIFFLLHNPFSSLSSFLYLTEACLSCSLFPIKYYQNVNLIFVVLFFSYWKKCWNLWQLPFNFHLVWTAFPSKLSLF